MTLCEPGRPWTRDSREGDVHPLVFSRNKKCLRWLTSGRANGSTFDGQTHTKYDISAPTGGRINPNNWQADDECGKSVLILRRTREGELMVMRLLCRKITCPRCGPWLKKRRMIQILRHLVPPPADSGEGQKAHIMIVDNKNHLTLRRALQRKIREAKQRGENAGYATFHLPGADGGMYLVFSPLAHKLRDDKSAITTVPYEELPRQVPMHVDMLEAWRDNRQSHSWKLGKKADPKWEKMGVVTTDMHKAIEIIKEYGFRVVEHREGFDDDRPGVVVGSLPDDLRDSEVVRSLTDMVFQEIAGPVA